MPKPPLQERLKLIGSQQGLEKWLGWARKKAQSLYQQGLSSKQVQMADGTYIAIQIVEPVAYITVWGGGKGAYQFIGSLARLYKTFRDPSYPVGTNRMLPLGYAVLVTIAGGKPKAIPLFSSAEAPPADRYWPYSADPRDTNTYLALTPAHQPDGMGVLQWYGPTQDVSKRNVPHLITAWQQALPCSALGWYSAGSATRFTTLDMAFDYGPTLFSADPRKGNYKIPHADWYGQAAWCMVDDPLWGSRSFIIMVDINSVFYCYPTEGYDAAPIWTGWLGEQGNVPAALTKNQACPWPSWVTTESLGVAAINAGVPDATHRGRLRPLWAFNHAGTRAACITAHRAANGADGYFQSSYYDDTGTLDTVYQEDTPGLVEVAFSINIIGSSLADFTFSVSVAREVYAGNPGIRAPVAVGYAVRPMGDIPLDALLLLEYQHLTDSPSQCQGPAAPLSGAWQAGVDPPLYDLTRPNKATVAVVKVATTDGWKPVRQWLAYYASYQPLGSPLPFYPHINEFSALAGADAYANHFVYFTNVVALDLNSLSFCIGVSVVTLGDIRTDYSTFDTYAAEAAALVTIALNSEQDRRTVGHPELKPVALAMFDGQSTYPDLATFTEFFPSATLDYAVYDPTWETDPIIKATRYATMTVRDGNDQTITRLVQGASEDMRGYSNIPNVATFAGASAIYGPMVYTFWDDLPSVRPGLRYAVGGSLQPGTLSFSGYAYGAIHHQAMLALTTGALNNVGARFSTHRSGSWAIFAGPIAARTDLSPWWRNGVRLSAPPLAYEQMLLDRIMIVDDANRRQIATTHIGSLNTAFDKALTPSDYFFELRYASDTGAEVRPASDDSAPSGWYPVSVLSPLGAIWSRHDFQAQRWHNDFCFDANFVLRKPHLAYNSFTTFPTPRAEGVFLPPR
jgi:hypothetical protein